MNFNARDYINLLRETFKEELSEFKLETRREFEIVKTMIEENTTATKHINGDVKKLKGDTKALQTFKDAMEHWIQGLKTAPKVNISDKTLQIILWIVWGIVSIILTFLGDKAWS